MSGKNLYSFRGHVHIYNEVSTDNELGEINSLANGRCLSNKFGGLQKVCILQIWEACGGSP